MSPIQVRQRIREATLSFTQLYFQACLRKAFLVSVLLQLDESLQETKMFRQKFNDRAKSKVAQLPRYTPEIFNRFCHNPYVLLKRYE